MKKKSIWLRLSSKAKNTAVILAQLTVKYSNGYVNTNMTVQNEGIVWLSSSFPNYTLAINLLLYYVYHDNHKIDLVKVLSSNMNPIKQNLCNGFLNYLTITNQRLISSLHVKPPRILGGHFKKQRNSWNSHKNQKHPAITTLIIIVIIKI